jgi:hypothetical protein
MLKCILEDVYVSATYDTAAQVCLVSRSWLDKHQLSKTIQPISNLLEDYNELQLKAANDTEIEYEGFTELKFSLLGWKHDRALKVPFLVSPKFDTPVIGTNVIEVIVHDQDNDNGNLISSMRTTFSSTCPENVDAFVKAIKLSGDDSSTFVKTISKGTHIPKKMNVLVSCTINSDLLNKDSPVMFEATMGEECPQGLEIGDILLKLDHNSPGRIVVPVSNPTDRDIYLPGRTKIGAIHTVQSVLPYDLSYNGHKESTTSKNQAEEENTVSPKIGQRR